MKHLKILGLAAVAAMALMAFIGVGSASADVLCQTAPNKAGECATSPGDYIAKTVFTAEATNPTLTVTGGFVSSVTCEKSNVTLENTSTGSNTPGTAVGGKITDLTFTGNCQTNSGSKCTVSTGSGYTGSIVATGNKGSGTFTVNSATSTSVTCLGFLECTYTTAANGLVLGYTGGNPAAVVANNETLAHEPGGFGCGSEAHWTATYNATGANSAVWVATKMA
jgi:hypothetical protein